MFVEVYVSFLIFKAKNSSFYEDTISDTICQKWFMKFHTRDFMLSRMPGRVDNNQILTLL